MRPLPQKRHYSSKTDHRLATQKGGLEHGFAFLPRFSCSPTHGESVLLPFWWLVCLTEADPRLLTRGLTQAFGAFNQYYVSTMLSDKSASSISWVGSAQVFLVVFPGVFTGPLFDSGHLRPLLLTGCALVVLGLGLLSIATAYWHVFLAQGLCIGLGSGLLYVPTLALVSTQFGDSVRPWAIGCVNGGGSVGGIMYTIMLRTLLPSIGFAWAVRSIALVALVLSVAALVILLPPTPRVLARRRAVLDLGALQEPPFLSFSLALFLNFVAFYIPPFFITVYATAALSKPPSFALDSLVYMSIGSFLGRTLPMLVAGRLGSLQVYFVAAVVTVIVLFAWIAVHDTVGLLIFCVTNGIVSGALVAAPSAAVSHPVLSPTMSLIGTRMGMAWMFAGLGVLIGAPIAGALVRLTPGHVSFTPLQVFAGAFVAGTVGCLLYPLIAVMEYDKEKRGAEATRRT